MKVKLLMEECNNGSKFKWRLIHSLHIDIDKENPIESFDLSYLIRSFEKECRTEINYARLEEFTENKIVPVIFDSLIPYDIIGCMNDIYKIQLVADNTDEADIFIRIAKLQLTEDSEVKSFVTGIINEICVPDIHKIRKENYPTPIVYNSDNYIGIYTFEHIIIDGKIPPYPYIMFIHKDDLKNQTVNISCSETIAPHVIGKRGRQINDIADTLKQAYEVAGLKPKFMVNINIKPIKEN